MDPGFVVQVARVDRSYTSEVVLAQPTRFRAGSYHDTLQNDTFYLTAGAIGGFTNLFISQANYILRIVFRPPQLTFPHFQINMLYLATLSDRVPILAPFAPSDHISSLTQPLSWHDVFDLPRLRWELRRHILEWDDVKHSGPASQTDSIGCWSIRNKAEENANLARHLNLDMSFTEVPASVRKGGHGMLGPLASLIYPRDPSVPRNLPVTKVSAAGTAPTPDRHLVCFDSLFYTTSSLHDWEYEHPSWPTWNIVGRHVHFSEDVNMLVYAYLRKVFGVQKDWQIPPFITVHIRHGDFTSYCKDKPVNECWTSLATYADKVQEVRDDILARYGVNVTEVIVSSDETDPSFWEKVAAQGWKSVDHAAERTVERLGEWYPPIIDTAIQSMGKGFVGTSHSSLSSVTQRRVEDWNKGPTRLVTFG
ncbi:hypothetical protein FISHEDRAFT_77825 [Fistulina hepatica ATCC 64428]|nr:hypothetical protein FISHEDRAFT_77825 [Fistulina hepatica ATCC 64428]